MHVKCPRCRAEVNARAGTTATCAECGHRFILPQLQASKGDFQPATAAEVAAHAPLSKPHVRRRPPLTRERIAYGLAFNVLVPGAGTMYTGRQGEGGGQLALFIVGILTLPLLVGLAFVPAAWVWALLSSIQHLIEFDRAHAARHH